MRKLTFRFTAYFTIGLLIFMVYLAIMFSFLISIFDPIHVSRFVYMVDSPATIFKHVLILLFCFTTGGLLFSIFLVYPLIYIISSINSLSQGDYSVENSIAIDTEGKIKWPYFLYMEVIQNIFSVSQALENSRREREKLDESKNEWIAGVSHDLKTPLSYVTGYSSLVMNKEHSWEIQDIMPYIEEIYHKGMYMESLIEDLNFTFFMDHVDQLGLNMEKTDIVAFMQNIMADIANTPKAQAYEFGFCSNIEELEWNFDNKLFYRAVFNLLINAMEHNPEGTEITLSLQQQEENTLLEISDNGIGMDTETLDNLFSRYYSTKGESRLHKGLGLSIAKQIVEAHGGSITAESSPGKGSVFHITLPPL